MFHLANPQWLQIPSKSYWYPVRRMHKRDSQNNRVILYSDHPILASQAQNQLVLIIHHMIILMMIPHLLLLITASVRTVSSHSLSLQTYVLIFTYISSEPTSKRVVVGLCVCFRERFLEQRLAAQTYYATPISE